METVHRTVIAAAKRGASATGVEFNADMVALSNRSAKREGVSDKAKFIHGDIFKTDFSHIENTDETFWVFLARNG